MLLLQVFHLGMLGMLLFTWYKPNNTFEPISCWKISFLTFLKLCFMVFFRNICSFENPLFQIKYVMQTGFNFFSPLTSTRLLSLLNAMEYNKGGVFLFILLIIFLLCTSQVCNSATSKNILQLLPNIKFLPFFSLVHHLLNLFKLVCIQIFFFSYEFVGVCYWNISFVLINVTMVISFELFVCSSNLWLLIDI